MTLRPQTGKTGAALRLASALLCIGLAAWGLIVWPVGGSFLAAGVAVYAIMLWRWPGAFLVVLPVVLPALDLGLWTGWMVVTEADLFVLVTLAVLLYRVPPVRADLSFGRLTQAVLLLLIVSTAGSTVMGLLSPLGFDGRSGNPFLRQDNALRLAKSLAEALVLLPFLLQRRRTQPGALAWLAGGIAAGLAVVTFEVLAERVLFAGILDFTTDYRVAGPFSSMHVGGGHIGAYVSLALPYAFAVGLLSLRWLPLACVAGVGGAYTLIVTFARTGYAAGLLGCAAMGLALLPARWRRGGLARALAVAPIVLVVIAVIAAASSGVMRQRLAIAATDLLTRETNWQTGWAARDPGLVTEVLGMGLGTYQRAMLSRSGINRPSDFGLMADDAGRFAWIRVESPFYLGQKIALPQSGSVRLTLRFRGDTPAASVGWLICDKVLLYSDNCQSGQTTPTTPGKWESVSATLVTANLGAGAFGGLIHRPVELSLFGVEKGTTIAIRDVRLTDEAGHELLANGDFRKGLDRWLFTDDSHVSWRILNQYLMLLFESGAVGLTAYLALSALAISGGIRGALLGDPIGAAVAGSVASFLVSGLFDNVLEAPRVATLFYLICMAGVIMWQRGVDGRRSAFPPERQNT